MLPLTLDNTLLFGYGDGLFNPQDKVKSDTLWCKYFRCAREPFGFRRECVATAEKLYEQANSLGRDLYVMLSGGMDSEVTLLSFLEAKVPVKVAIFNFQQRLNYHDTATAFSLCKYLGIEPKVLELPVLDWINGPEAEKIFNESQCESMGLVAHMKLMSVIWEQWNGVPVLGNGDIYMELDGEEWKYTELEKMLSWYRHAIKNEILGGIGFFQHTPEIVLAALREPIMEQLGTGKNKLANRIFETTRYLKYQMYLRHWPQLKPRVKLGGSELVRAQFVKRSKELLMSRTVSFNDKFQVPYSVFREMLEP